MLLRFKANDLVFKNGLLSFIRRYRADSGYIFPKEEDEYTEVPQYPEIEPVDEEYVKRKEQKKWHDKIKRQKTIEEKLIEMNVPRFWGWKCLLLKEGEIPYNSLEFLQYITRTHLVQTDDLPGHYSKLSTECSGLANKIKKHIQDLIVEDHFNIRHKHIIDNSEPEAAEKELTKIIVNELNRIILIYLQKENNLELSQVDYCPRLESFWYLGSLPDTYEAEHFEHGLPQDMIPEEYLGRPCDKFIQYIGNPIIQLRVPNPLPAIVNINEATYFQYPVPIYKYDPFVVFDYEMVRRHVTSIPGFWPGESREFSLLSYHDVNHLKYRNETYGLEEKKETIQCQAVLASFAWLMSIAHYQGFSSYHDVTYPLLTQTVLTDGRHFNFAVYQLNTTELYHEDPLFNPRCNICWITPTMELYKVENGEIRDLNENVINLLLQFYKNKTEDKALIKRKPYLDEQLEVVANFEDQEKREWLEKTFKHISSNRPRKRVDKMYEVADFERIYKIQFAKLIRDPRKRPFELKENPYLRKLSDHTPEYIPRALRPDAELPKYKQRKFKKVYYPE